MRQVLRDIVQRTTLPHAVSLPLLYVSVIVASIDYLMLWHVVYLFHYYHPYFYIYYLFLLHSTRYSCH